jgi:hypothetical protein
LRATGHGALALSVLLRVLRAGSGTAPAARSILEILQQEPRFLCNLQSQDIDITARSLPVAQALVLCDLAGRADLVLDLVTAPGLVDADDLADLARRMTEAARIGDAAILIAAWRTSGRADRITHAALRRVIDTWVARAIDQPDRNQRIALLSAVVQVHPLHVEGRLALRTARREILAELRASANACDLAALEALKPQIDQLEEPMPEYALARMRLLQHSGDLSGAISAAQDILAKDSDHLIAWVTLMRAAQKTGDLLAMETAAQAIVARADDDCRRIEDEARDRLERNPALCFRAARSETDPLKAHRLFTIALRHPGFAQAAGLRIRRIEAELAATFRNPDQVAEPQTDALARAAAALAPANPRLCLSLGRYLFRRQEFSAALPHWEFLSRSAPENPSYALHATRCRARLGPLPSEQSAEVSTLA